MSAPAPAQFLDVSTLLEQSQPRRSWLRGWHLLGVFLFVAMLGSYFARNGDDLSNTISGLVMLGLVVCMMLIAMRTVRRSRNEQAAIEAVDELLRLRRFNVAATLTQQMLSSPRAMSIRLQSLMQFSMILQRYDRFDDALAVQDYLLQNAQLDAGTAHGLKISRAMSLLRQDQLVDADRAINDLRREVNQVGRAMHAAQPDENAEAPPAPQALSAGLAMVEMYRDVKTGHPAEALEIFKSATNAIREQLGHRAADAFLLAAQACDVTGDTAGAQTNYESATLLAPPAELHRRFPEAAALKEKYRPAVAPLGAR